jgi:hypothetical protein
MARRTTFTDMTCLLSFFPSPHHFFNAHPTSPTPYSTSLWRNNTISNAALTKFDISKNDLCAAGAKILADVFNANQVMTELNLSGNYLGKEDPWGSSNSDMSGVIALADVIPGMGMLIKLDIRENRIASKHESSTCKQRAAPAHLRGRLQHICAAAGIELDM